MRNPAPDPVLSARSRFNATRRYHGADAEATVAAARDLAAEKLAAYVASIVADAPPLAPEQVDRIAALLRPSAASTSAA